MKTQQAQVFKPMNIRNKCKSRLIRIILSIDQRKFPCTPNFVHHIELSSSVDCNHPRHKKGSIHYRRLSQKDRIIDLSFVLIIIFEKLGGGERGVTDLRSRDVREVSCSRLRLRLVAPTESSSLSLRETTASNIHQYDCMLHCT